MINAGWGCTNRQPGTPRADAAWAPGAAWRLAAGRGRCRECGGQSPGNAGSGPDGCERMFCREGLSWGQGKGSGFLCDPRVNQKGPGVWWRLAVNAAWRGLEGSSKACEDAQLLVRRDAALKFLALPWVARTSRAASHGAGEVGREVSYEGSDEKSQGPR